MALVGWYSKDVHGVLKAMNDAFATTPAAAHFPGSIRGRPHDGIDLYGPIGTPILAAEAGKVTFAGPSGGTTVLRVEIRPGSGYQYIHCSKLLVAKGAHVKRGQTIALMGDKGVPGHPHLHFSVWHNELGVLRLRQNPARFYPPKTFLVGTSYRAKWGTYLASTGDFVNSDWVFPLTTIALNSPDVNVRLSPDAAAPLYTGSVPASFPQLNWVEGGEYTVGAVTGTTWAKAKMASVVYIAKPLVHNI